MSSFLPREGLTLEVVFAPLGWTLFEPIFTGVILMLLSYFPDQIKSCLPNTIQHYIYSTHIVFALKLLLGFGIVIKLNSNLSRLALNNYVTSTWDHGKEVVVITGGTGGLGKALAFAFAPSAAAVVILDIKEPNINDIYRTHLSTPVCEAGSINQFENNSKECILPPHRPDFPKPALQDRQTHPFRPRPPNSAHQQRYQVGQQDHPCHVGL